MNDKRRQFDCVIFDMDGTLISSELDFVAIRADLGIDVGLGIIEAIELMDASQRAKAHAKLLEYELASARRATLLRGAVEVLDTSRAMGLKLALLTRNTCQAVDIVLERFESLKFDLVRCREDGIIKPEPDGVLMACGMLGVDPARTMCVGDFHYDIQAANSAGATSVLLTTNPGCDAYAGEADFVINELGELLKLLE